MFEPGTTWEYSMSTDVLGRVVEVVSGQGLAEFFAAHITGPLGMADTAFEAAGEKAARVAEPQTDASGVRPPMRNVARPHRWASGGGGLVSTAADYLRFCQMLLNGGELDGVRLLAPKTIRHMASNHLPPNCGYGDTARERFGALAPVPEMGYGFGLGFCGAHPARHVAGAGLGRRIFLGRGRPAPISGSTRPKTWSRSFCPRPPTAASITAICRASWSTPRSPVRSRGRSAAVTFASSLRRCGSPTTAAARVRV